ncbi:MAG: hypothetical protein BGP01_01310 [Paludibacter sp. 47-17]|nr:MAG: hypothetical protein BGP01_01310 [Paludibacter sp. 47-17]
MRLRAFPCIRVNSRAFIALVAGLMFYACSPAKFVPEGSFLLDKVEVKSDAREIDKSDLDDYVRQSPNSSILGLFRMQLGIYNLSDNDTTRWWNRMLRRVGQPPVIYDPALTDASAAQLISYHKNKGYFNATISTDVTMNRKKANVIYNIKAGQPYRINSYTYDLPNDTLKRVANDSLRTLIQRGDIFDVNTLNNERERISNRMRRDGYYNFTRDHLIYTADSVEKMVDVTIQLRDYLMAQSDSLSNTVFQRFAVSRVEFIVNPSVSSVAGATELLLDTIRQGRYTLIGPVEKVLTLQSLIAGSYIRPGRMYSDQDVENTYSLLNSLPPVKYTDISFSMSAKDSLLCRISIAEAKSFTLTSQAEITYTAGYWGLAGNLGTVHRNVFSGAESLILQGRLALEWQGDVMAQEWGGQAAIRVPRTLLPEKIQLQRRLMQGSTDFRALFSFQSRPGEFSSTNVGSGIKYNWSSRRFNRSLDLVDISYVYFPWISTQFRDSFLTTGLYNRYNYDDYLIMRMSYGASFQGYNPNRPMRNFMSYRYSVETAGNVLYGIDKLFRSPVDSLGNYRIFNIRYSQYVRGEVNASYHQIVDKNNKLVYHAGVGIAYPYGNAEVIPFERRFYSGGANSVRGWSESTLGPGSYERFNSLRRDYNQLGDIKLDLNMEYRAKMFWVLEGALFIDAGNIWTVRDYKSQPGGYFRLNTFWKQIALAYGAGLRMDFSFLLFRLDAGLKLYDPARIPTQPWRAPSFKDMAVHIAIGYPF